MHDASRCNTAPTRLQLAVSAAGLARLFSWIVASLLLAHVVVQGLRFATGNERLFGLVYMFNLGADANFPSFYSSAAILFACMLLLVIARHSQSDRPYWWGLAVVFLFLSVDEMLEIHEKLIGPLRSMLQADGVFFYAWVIPYGVAALLFGAANLRFLARLPRRTAVLFVVAGAVFVSGAIGMEVVGSVLAAGGRVKTIAYVLAQTVEELLEMGGIVLFIYALADYISRHLGGLTVRLN